MSAAPRVEIDCGVPVADGITLATDVYRPAADKPVPVVLLRTPYDRKTHLSEALTWCRHGIACVVQDVRGRYGSEGAFAPYRHERCDGAATVDWLTRQEWAADIVAYGGSYAAFTAWAVAAEVAVVAGLPDAAGRLAAFLLIGCLRFSPFCAAQDVPPAPAPQVAPTPAEPQAVHLQDYSKPRPAFPHFLQPYRTQAVAQPNLANSPRIDSLLHDGKVYLSIDDAVAPVGRRLRRDGSGRGGGARIVGRPRPTARGGRRCSGQQLGRIGRVCGSRDPEMDRAGASSRREA